MNRIILSGLFFILVPATAGAEVVNEELNGDLKLIREDTGFGMGRVACPVGWVALGGGAHCDTAFVELDVHYPLVAQDPRTMLDLPVGWNEWHRGADLRNECEVFAICVPAWWFAPRQIKVESRNTSYGIGTVSCAPDPVTGIRYLAISGGSHCSDGDMDTSYPGPGAYDAVTSALTDSWSEHHRGASSRDCSVHAVCVDEKHWIARSSRHAHSDSSTGLGRVRCGSGISIGGGAYADGKNIQHVTSYPSGNLDTWQQTTWMDPLALITARVYATCLDVNDVADPGAPCEAAGLLLDCDHRCVSQCEVLPGHGNGLCDDGSGDGANLDCEAFAFDGGECN